MARNARVIIFATSETDRYFAYGSASSEAVAEAADDTAAGADEAADAEEGAAGGAAAEDSIGVAPVEETGAGPGAGTGVDVCAADAVAVDALGAADEAALFGYHFFSPLGSSLPM